VTAPVQRKTDAAGQRREAHAAPESRPSIKSLFGGQRKPMAAPASAEPASEPERHEVLDSAKAQRFGAQLGADFSGVTIHRGDGVAHDHGAAAIAFARDIHFAPGMCETRGDALLGHELVHTVQQHGVPTTGPAPRQASTEATAEAEAETIGRSAARGVAWRRAARGAVGDAAQTEAARRRRSGARRRGWRRGQGAAREGR
jgi:hypothetical protein